MSVISVENLGKKYVIRQDRHAQGCASFPSFRESLAQVARGAYQRVRHPLRPGPSRSVTEEFWALRSVDFEVRQGDRVGIIGRNGAGKSTILKVLSRITEPTTGRIEIDGRVASLLEVGTGFHPELSGRENIYLNAAILGMSRTEITERFDEIVAFADIERFLDTPVKRYSSGMYVRLAFSVAAHLQPEILIVDEVLAVGDAQFQKRCLGKMREVGGEGRTVIFVSHNMAAVRALCSRVILLEEGRVSHDGKTEESITRYSRSVAEQISFERSWQDPPFGPGNKHLRLHRIGIVATDETPPSDLSVRDSFDVEIEYWNLKSGARLSISMHLVTDDNVIAFASTTWEESEWNGRYFPSGLYRSRCRVPGDLLNVGPYTIHLYFLENSTRLLCKIDDALNFQLMDSTFGRGEWHGKWDGSVRPQLKWTTSRLSDSLDSTDPGDHRR